MSLPEIPDVPEPELPTPAILRQAVDMELDALDTPEQAEGGRFSVSDRTQADWVGRLRRRRLDELAAVKRRAEKQRAAVMAAIKPYLDPIDEWESDRSDKLTREVESLEAILTEYHRHEVETSDADAPLTITLPHVVLKSRKNPDRWTFEDSFVAWAEKHRPDLIRAEPTKPAVKKVVRVLEGGMTVVDVTDDGEMEQVPGVTVELGDRNYWVADK